MRTRESSLGTLILIVVFLAPRFRPALADLISTGQAVSASRVQAQREKVRAFVNRPDVERGLKALGVKPELAKHRVEAFTEDEVVKIAGRIDALPASDNLALTDWIIILFVATVLAI